MLQYRMLLVVFLSLLSVADRAAADDAPENGLTLLSAGTLVENETAERWNKVVLLAKPRLASGDLESIPGFVRDLVGSFILTILATVEPYDDPATGTRRFRLTELGAGFCMNVDGVLKIVTPDEYAKAGASLGFVQKRMLSENSKQLGNVSVLARTSTLVMFDVPAIMLREGKHQDFRMRHFIWIDANTGKNAALVWLMKEEGDKLIPVEEPIRMLPGGLKEDRAIHVDDDEFLLGGFPTERAFALESLPPGAPVSWTQEVKTLATLPQYDVEAIKSLTLALNRALQATRQLNSRMR